MFAKQGKDFTSGPIFSRMILFVIPLILTGILQLFYSMADHAIVGKFSGDEYALAAVGAVGAILLCALSLFTLPSLAFAAYHLVLSLLFLLISKLLV